MSANSLVVPEYTFRGYETAEFLNITDRLVDVLMDEENGLPEADVATREMVSDAAEAMNGLAARMGIDRKGEFTGQKREADRSRKSYSAALTRVVRGILTDPHPKRSVTKVAAAERLRKVFAPNLANFARKSSAQRSTALRLLFADCRDESVQADLITVELLDYYNLLVTAQETFARIVKLEGRSEADPEPAEAQAEATGSPAVGHGTFLSYKEAARDALKLAFGVMVHHAKRGREPYAALLAQSQAIIAELATITKGRETRAKKAKTKEAAKAQESEAKPSETREAKATPSAQRNEQAAHVADGLSN